MEMNARNTLHAFPIDRDPLWNTFRLSARPSA